jgi:hypothetical protein
VAPPPPGHYDGEGLTPKREAFARAYLELGNARKAYEAAYDCKNLKSATIGSRAHAILRHPVVERFIETLRVEAAKRNEINIDNLTQMLLEDRKLARELGMPSAAITGVMSVAKLHGLLVEKSKVTVEKSLANMNDDELDAFIIAEATAMGFKREP